MAQSWRQGRLGSELLLAPKAQPGAGEGVQCTPVTGVTGTVTLGVSVSHEKNHPHVSAFERDCLPAGRGVSRGLPAAGQPPDLSSCGRHRHPLAGPGEAKRHHEGYHGLVSYTPPPPVPSSHRCLSGASRRAVVNEGESGAVTPCPLSPHQKGETSAP